jgi:transcriptional regulator with XRE-family HTH domain
MKAMTRQVNPASEAIIGDRIRTLRMLRKMSQTDLGTALGVTFQQVQKYEKGVNRVSGSRLVMLAQLLGSTPDEILTGARVKNGDAVIDAKMVAVLKDPSVLSVLIGMGQLSPPKRKACARAILAIVEMAK